MSFRQVVKLHNSRYSLPDAKRRWARSPDGVAHSLRQSEGEHHSARCGKYVRAGADDVIVGHPPFCCPECSRLLEDPIPAVNDGDPVPRLLLCVVQNSRHRKIKQTGHY